MPLKIVRRKDTGALTIEGTIELPDGTRQRIRKRAQTDSPVLAKEEATTLEAEILRSAWHGERRGVRTFGEALKVYIESQERSESTKRRLYHLMRAIGDLPLSKINQEVVNRAKISMGITNPSTAKRGVITPLRAVLMQAHRLGWCDVPHFEIPREPAGRTRFLLPHEAEQLIDAASPHLKHLLTFLLCTGARMAEALELDWRDVDGQRAIFWRTKGGFRRIATLPPRASQSLHLASLRENGGAVFRTQFGLPYADRGRQGGGQIKTAWKATLRRSGLDPELTPHDLRHTWASWHYAVNKDLLALKVGGGWSSVMLVERYAHLMPAGHEDSIRAFWHGGVTGHLREVV
jgi:integrase